MEGTMLPNDTAHNTKSNNASNVKDMDTKQTVAPGKQRADTAHRNTKQGHAPRRSTNARTAVAHTPPGTTSARDD